MTDPAAAIPTAAAAPTVYIETFGCQMNVLDTQLVRGQLQALGYRFIDDWKQADVILYNTCSVREQAENKALSRVGEVGMLKKERPGVVLGVIGCMAERDGVDMTRRHPQIDLICGPGELDKVPMLIDNVMKTDPKRRGGKFNAQVALQGNMHRRSSTLAAAEDQLEMLDLSRSFDPDEHKGSAYVRITRGCNKFCTYCVVPMTRGAEVHRPPDHIVEECRKLVESGVVEVTLLGQTVNHYHYDHAAAVTINGLQQPQVGSVVNLSSPLSRGEKVRERAGVRASSSSITSFAELLARIHDEVPALRRLRFVTNFPRDFGDDILQVMRDSPRICRYLHLPVQSGSNRMLKLMNRGYEVREYRDLIDRARAFLPDVQIATDIICGFPTETEEDHAATVELLKYCRFKNAFIFKYSPRPGTAAIDRFEDDVPDDVKRRRNNELLALQIDISGQVHAACVGQTVRVFVESISEHSQRELDGGLPGSGSTVSLGWQKPQRVTQLTGRTDGDLIVCFDGDASMIGSIVEVKIERSAPLTLFGRVEQVSAASR
ncbi:MAG: radical SAM protein [Planctomycetes bacterium]|nr:radical SAM protein [Planctomycetota bacterium]